MRKNIVTSIKKSSKRFFKKKRRFDRFQQKQTIFDSNEFFENSKIVMNDALFIEQNFDFLRISSRRKILIQIFKTRYDLFQSNNKKSIVFSSTSFANSKKRFITFINDNDDDDDNEIQTFIKTFKFVIKQKIKIFLIESQSSVIKNRNIFQKFVVKQKIKNFLIESQRFVIKNRILFQKFLFKRSFFDNLIFISIRVIIQIFTSTFFTLKSRNYLQSIMLNQKKLNYSINCENHSFEKKLRKTTAIFS